MRDADGYTSTWFDEEAVVLEDAEYYYSFTAPIDDTDLYFTVESFFQAYIPWWDCWDPRGDGLNLVYI